MYIWGYYIKVDWLNDDSVELTLYSWKKPSWRWLNEVKLIFMLSYANCNWTRRSMKLIRKSTFPFACVVLWLISVGSSTMSPSKPGGNYVYMPLWSNDFIATAWRAIYRYKMIPVLFTTASTSSTNECSIFFLLDSAPAKAPHELQSVSVDGMFIALPCNLRDNYYY